MSADLGYPAAFIVGLLGGVHCAGMCGGIVGVLTLGQPEARRGGVFGFGLHLAYSAGRVLSYALAGALVGGLAGHQIASYMDRQEQQLRDAVAQSDAVSISRTQNVLTATFKGDVLFDFNSAMLKPGAYTEIDRVARVLSQYPQTMVRVEGHTDAIGSEV